MSENRTYSQDEVNALLAAQGLSEQNVRYVGIRWFGHGGVTLRLKNAVAGGHSLILQGYGDAGVIDHGTWFDLRKKELVRLGLIVRDDSVVREQGFTGIVDAPDKERASINGYLDSEIIKIFKGPLGKFEKVIASLNTHHACAHFMHVSGAEGLGDLSRDAIVDKRYHYLLTKFRWELLLDHDLRPACERYGIDWTTISREEMIEALTRIEIENEN